MRIALLALTLTFLGCAQPVLKEDPPKTVQTPIPYGAGKAADWSIE